MTSLPLTAYSSNKYNKLNSGPQIMETHTLCRIKKLKVTGQISNWSHAYFGKFREPECREDVTACFQVPIAALLKIQVFWDLSFVDR
jgi:hypothetical protein